MLKLVIGLGVCKNAKLIETTVSTDSKNSPYPVRHGIEQSLDN